MDGWIQQRKSWLQTLNGFLQIHYKIAVILRALFPLLKTEISFNFFLLFETWLDLRLINLKISINHSHTWPQLLSISCNAWVIFSLLFFSIILRDI